MRITLTQSEIERAVLDYIADKGVEFSSGAMAHFEHDGGIRVRELTADVYLDTISKV